MWRAAVFLWMIFLSAIESITPDACRNTVERALLVAGRDRLARIPDRAAQLGAQRRVVLAAVFGLARPLAG